MFGTAGIRGPVTEITPELARSVGLAVGEPGATVVVGRDGRTTGSALAAALSAGLQQGGATVARLGQVPTPALAYASRGRTGVMITASHNPPTDNGIKLFADGVEFDRDAEARIERALEEGPTVGIDWDQWGIEHSVDMLAEYRRAVVEYVTSEFSDDARAATAPLDGLTVAVDCGCGVGGLATPQVLERLGASVVALNANVDGHFPARESKPTPASLESFSALLAERPVDLGIAHDGDADRLVVLDSAGDVLHEDTVLAVVAAHYVRAATTEEPVVLTTPNASARIDEQVRAAGGRTERVGLGRLHEGIADLEEESAGDDGAVVFAAEPWKHIHPAFGGWIDGVVSAAVVAALVSECGALDSLREPVTERPYVKVAIDCPETAKAETMAVLEERLPAAFPAATVDDEYGLRLQFCDDAWLLVRPSGTEPYVRLYAESETVDELVADARTVVERAVEDAI